jgi:hypothetical protein
MEFQHNFNRVGEIEATKRDLALIIGYGLKGRIWAIT